MTRLQMVAALPIVVRCAVIGTSVMGIVGCAVGLTVGLKAYVPTAWFATFEIGIPAALVGLVLGTVTGLVVLVVQKARGIN